jgi:hypothetical protein
MKRQYTFTAATILYQYISFSCMGDQGVGGRIILEGMLKK